MMPKQPYDVSASQKKVARKRLIWFKLIGILTPFLLLILLEFFLRLFNYGYNPHLFIENAADKNYLVLNPEASKVYFLNQAIATTGNTELFKKEKDGNTLRIFVLGESTTIGYPYFHNGSFHRWLQYRLMHEFPDKNFEIINLALTAVNSYTVLGFARELIKYKPDAVMIYTGHNEYYGALGVGSTDRIGGNTGLVNLTIALRRWKIVQLMTNAYMKVANLFRSKKENIGKTRMEFMVADQQIPYGSTLFNRGINQFSSNLDATLKLFHQHNIPVFVSNLVSNEKDLKPFIDLASDSLSLPMFQKNYALGLQSLAAKDSSQAAAYFTLAHQAYPSHASCNYYLGRLAYGKGDYSKATLFFSKAHELDALRFRAPAQMNEVIAELCTKYSNTHLVDTKAVFKASSTGQIIGDELLFEHVHPNLMGYALLSDAFYQAIKKAGLIPAPSGTGMPLSELLHRMPITTMDSLTGAYRIDHLKKSWPFTNAASELPDGNALHTEEEKLAFAVAFQKMGWTDATGNLYRYYIENHQLQKAKTLVETLVLEHPTEENYYANAANVCGELKDYEDAVFYFKKSFLFSPSFDKARYLFVMYFMMDRPEEAIPFLDYAISNGPASLQPVKAAAIEIMQLKNRLSGTAADIKLLNQVAVRYLKMGNNEGAEKYITKVLELDKANKEALLMREEIQKSKVKIQK